MNANTEVLHQWEAIADAMIAEADERSLPAPERINIRRHSLVKSRATGRRGEIVSITDNTIVIEFNDSTHARKPYSCAQFWALYYTID